MTPYEILGLSLLAVVVTAASALVRSRARRDLVKTINDLPSHRTYDDYDPHPAPKSNISFEKIKSDDPVRTFGKRPALGAPYGKRAFVPPTKHPTITLSPRQIERINAQRKLFGKPPFNRKGLTNAVAHPWDRYDVRQPQSTNDWISYLIAYEIFFADHQSPDVGGCQGLNIDPNLPYNGHGGEYAGAGASGDWGNSLTRSEAAAIEHGADQAGGLGDGNYPQSSPSDPSSSGPGPSYSAPDPAPSSDSSSSYSSSSDSSSSSSSYDSGSSSSFDSGSSSGGGGGGD